MKILMIIAPQDFRDEEYFEPHTALLSANHTVTVASTKAGQCTSMQGATVHAQIGIDAIKADQFDSAIYVGGSGAACYFNDPNARRIAIDMFQQGKLIAAICIAPVIFARAGLLKARNATVFSSEEAELAKAGAHLINKGVVKDGQIITARGPKDAKDFAREVIHALATQVSVE